MNNKPKYANDKKPKRKKAVVVGKRDYWATKADRIQKSLDKFFKNKP